MASWIAYIGVGLLSFSLGAALFIYLDTAHCKRLESRCYRQELNIERLKSEAAQRGEHL